MGRFPVPEGPEQRERLVRMRDVTPLQAFDNIANCVRCCFEDVLVPGKVLQQQPERLQADLFIGG
ncbi:hypothetical protein DLJ57_12055 [Micromonospora chalcea]|nr:hypothetical protein A8711_30820 [Micromonospora sp. II]RQX48035.1 hypothetical protein DLJ57_12055 [Micromonospora chalcea]